MVLYANGHRLQRLREKKGGGEEKDELDSVPDTGQVWSLGSRVTRLSMRIRA